MDAVPSDAPDPELPMPEAVRALPDYLQRELRHIAFWSSDDLKAAEWVRVHLEADNDKAARYIRFNLRGLEYGGLADDEVLDRLRAITRAEDPSALLTIIIDRLDLSDPATAEASIRILRE